MTHRSIIAKKRRPTNAVGGRRRAVLLDRLLWESRTRSGTGYSKYETGSPLIELANAAAYASGRHIVWRGIRFPLRHGLFLAVLDPRTRKPLIFTNGGIV